MVQTVQPMSLDTLVKLIKFLPEPSNVFVEKKSINIDPENGFKFDANCRDIELDYNAHFTILRLNKPSKKTLLQILDKHEGTIFHSANFYPEFGDKGDNVNIELTAYDLKISCWNNNKDAIKFVIDTICFCSDFNDLEVKINKHKNFY